MAELDMKKVDRYAADFNVNPQTLQRLLESAAQAKENAYCTTQDTDREGKLAQLIERTGPYSKFRVGAAFLSFDNIIKGANVENASYPVGTCAERVALATAITSGTRKFHALAVSTDISPPASPCGMCRQFIREFCDLSMPIFMLDKNQSFEVMKLEELLPMSFGPDALLQPPQLH